MDFNAKQKYLHGLKSLLSKLLWGFFNPSNFY